MIYYSLIFSHLIYAIEVWGNAHSTLINRIFILQKRAVRAIVYKDMHDINYALPQSNPLFLKLSIMKIHNIFKLKLITFVYKCLYQIHPVNFYNWFIFSNRIHSHITRSSTQNNIFIPQIRTTNYGLKSIKYNGAKSWNTLNSNIKFSNDIATFTRLLKEYLVSH